MKTTTATVFFCLGLFFGSVTTALALETQRISAQKPQEVSAGGPMLKGR